MQVARLLENSGTGKLRGKRRQMRVALALERRYSKDQILGMYLAHAPYGGAVEGLRAGSLGVRRAPAHADDTFCAPRAPSVGCVAAC